MKDRRSKALPYEDLRINTSFEEHIRLLGSSSQAINSCLDFNYYKNIDSFSLNNIEHRISNNESLVWFRINPLKLNEMQLQIIPINQQTYSHLRLNTSFLLSRMTQLWNTEYIFAERKTKNDFAGAIFFPVWKWCFINQNRNRYSSNVRIIHTRWGARVHSK